MERPDNKDIGTKADLAKYRLELAQGDIRSAKALLGIDEFRGANNRAYYAIFHAISAVHALHGDVYKRHKDAIANFNKNYVATDIFPRKLGHAIAVAEEIRNASDYDDFYLASFDEAKLQIETAEELLECVENYIEHEEQ